MRSNLEVLSMGTACFRPCCVNTIPNASVFPLQEVKNTSFCFVKVGSTKRIFAFRYAREPDLS